MPVFFPSRLTNKVPPLSPHVFFPFELPFTPALYNRDMSKVFFSFKTLTLFQGAERLSFYYGEKIPLPPGAVPPYFMFCLEILPPFSIVTGLPPIRCCCFFSLSGKASAIRFLQPEMKLFSRTLSPPCPLPFPDLPLVK